MLVWSGHSSEEVSECYVCDNMLVRTGGQSTTKVAGDLRCLRLADSRQQVAACRTKQQAVECHVCWVLSWVRMSFDSELLPARRESLYARTDDIAW